MDDADRADRRIERFDADALAAQQERARQQVTPYLIDGAPHCPDCLEPLPAHRQAAGICVGCLTDREQQQRRVYGS
ncbi:TraR/DksA family transcriptional regulator [Sedimenticola hydrogenitrophicus]|uniref:TraR/DksA family transcriptional regulator n=1 Tax=Sedimenticola hydrogenitrophicus TaxID=2967975 RepID=UPI0023B1FF30|nr:TraR/DksA family transcriptional regulator [Sedimenticola hydrogenitrophicus]